MDGPRVSRRAFLGTAAGASVVLARPRGAPAAAGAVPGEVPRRVLGLYKSDETFDAVEGPRPKDATHNDIHLRAQMPLNWLGLMVDYHDISQGLPPDGAMGRYHGIVSWYQSLGMRDPLGYLRWLSAQIRAGRRVVILGTLGAFVDGRGRDVDGEALAEALGPTGLVFRGGSTEDPRWIEVRAKDPAMLEFERRLPPGLPNYYQVLSTNPQNRSHLVLGRRDQRDSPSHLVVTGPWGGFASDGFVTVQTALTYSTPSDPTAGMRAGETRYVTQWLIDPFRFLGEALGIRGWPRPDVTTFNGRRIAYSHIDGDGMRNLSEVRRRALSGEIIHDEILARTPFPISVSVVAAEVAPELLGSARTEALARAMFALPTVEAASHSFFHPLDWEKRTRSFEIPGHPFDLRRETVGSARFIQERLLPPGKRVQLFQWSGSTRVSEEAIALVDEAGLPNINGGDTMRDGAWPSYTTVAPLLRQVGRRWQVYTSAANENLYTNLWTGPFYGFRHVTETFRRTETDRRVCPVNIYYHFYSGERVAALKALRETYAWAAARPLAPLFTSEYAAMVAGFRTARLARTGEGWRVWDHGALRTVRFDDTAEGLDLERSHGVLGATRHGGALYVHLAGPEPATIVLRREAPPALGLVSASHRVHDWRRAPGALAFRLAGIGTKSAEVGGLRPGREVTVRLTDAAGSRSLRVRADGEGVAAFAAGDASEIEVNIG